MNTHRTYHPQILFRGGLKRKSQVHDKGVAHSLQHLSFCFGVRDHLSLHNFFLLQDLFVICDREVGY